MTNTSFKLEKIPQNSAWGLDLDDALVVEAVTNNVATYVQRNFYEETSKSKFHQIISSPEFAVSFYMPNFMLCEREQVLNSKETSGFATDDSTIAYNKYVFTITLDGKMFLSLLRSANVIIYPVGTSNPNISIVGVYDLVQDKCLQDGSIQLGGVKVRFSLAMTWFRAQKEAFSEGIAKLAPQFDILPSLDKNRVFNTWLKTGDAPFAKNISETRMALLTLLYFGCAKGNIFYYDTDAISFCKALPIVQNPSISAFATPGIFSNAVNTLDSVICGTKLHNTILLSLIASKSKEKAQELKKEDVKMESKKDVEDESSVDQKYIIGELDSNGMLCFGKFTGDYTSLADAKDAIRCYIQGLPMAKEADKIAKMSFVVLKSVAVISPKIKVVVDI